MNPFKLIRTILMVCCFLFATDNYTAMANEPSAAEYGVVINLSGKQRMLSQKMSKEVLLIHLNHEKQRQLTSLKATAALFDKTLTGLRDGDESLGLPPTSSRRILRQIDQKIHPVWNPFHVHIKGILDTKNVSPDQLEAIARLNPVLLSEMNKCVKLYEREAAKTGLKSDPSLAVTINLSGKQRMLTQKMSKEFLLIASRHHVEENRLNLQETYGLFERTLNGLLDGDPTLDLTGTKDPAIQTQLKKIQTLWEAFKPLVEPAAQTKHDITADQIARVAELNLPLLTEMNTAVKMYERLASN